MLKKGDLETRNNAGRFSRLILIAAFPTLPCCHAALFSNPDTWEILESRILRGLEVKATVKKSA